VTGKTIKPEKRIRKSCEYFFITSGILLNKMKVYPKYNGNLAVLKIPYFSKI
jgi:hypothetical protein